MSDSPLRQGALIAGRYLLEQHLGEGGMGTVWEATHTVTRHSVAMKFLKESLRNKAELRQRFLREASAASALRHPHVVEILDVFDFEERMPVLVMELLRGETLGNKLLRDERLSMEETAALVLPVVSAVGAAHALGIVHRDIKPENVFLVNTGNETRVKVLDFGIAKLMTEQYQERGGSALHTATGSLLGTPSYMAPEQATGDGVIDHRADIWSLGVILYECLSGMRPIEGDNLAQVVTRLLSSAIIPLDNLAPQLPREVTALVMQMLTRDPQRRTPDLLEISKVLARYTRVQIPAFGLPVTGFARSSLPPPSLQAAPVRPSAPPVRSLPAEPPRVQVGLGAGVDPRGSTLLSSPPTPSPVTVHSDETGKPPQSRGKRVAPAVGLGLAFTVAVIAAFRLPSPVFADKDKPTGPASQATSASAPVIASPSTGSPLEGPDTDAKLAVAARKAASEGASSVRAKASPLPRASAAARTPRSNREQASTRNPAPAPSLATTSKAVADEGSLFKGRK